MEEVIETIRKEDEKTEGKEEKRTEEKKEENGTGEETETKAKPVKIGGKVLFSKENQPEGRGRPRESAETKLIKKAAREVAMSILMGSAPKAARKLSKLMDEAKSEQVKLGAADSILDRAGIGTQNKQPLAAIQINFNDDKYK